MNLVLSSHPHAQSILPLKKLLETWPSPLTCPGSLEIWVLMLRMLAELKLKEALPCEPWLQAQQQPRSPKGKCERAKYTCPAMTLEPSCSQHLGSVPLPCDSTSDLSSMILLDFNHFSMVSWHEADRLPSGYHWAPGVAVTEPCPQIWNWGTSCLSKESTTLRQGGHTHVLQYLPQISPGCVSLIITQLHFLTLAKCKSLFWATYIPPLVKLSPYPSVVGLPIVYLLKQ